MKLVGKKHSKASAGLSLLLLLLSYTAHHSKHARRLLTAAQNAQNNNASAAQRVPASSELTCKQEMMTSYGLQGRAQPTKTGHQFCPSVTANCCTQEDEDISMKLWQTDSMRKIEAYYETYLYSLKYILGFAYEINLLADEFAESDRSGCKNAAEEFKKMNINREVAKEIFKAFVDSLEKMAEVRRGFYCVLCDAVTQTRLKDYWSITNVFYSDRVYFNQQFCQDLVEHTIRASYYEIFYVKRFAELATNLMSCRIGKQNMDELEYEVPYWTQQQVKNCYYFKNKYFFFFCENYCEKFHLTKANAIFDGNLEQLQKFVEFIAQNRKAAFYDDDNNFLLGGVSWQEDYLEENFREFNENNNNKVFFKPVTNQIMLDKFETDVLLEGGFNPLDSTKGSLYPIELAGVEVWGKITAFLTLVFLVFK